jgi:hypothetical protein
VSDDVIRPKFGTTLTVDDRPHKCQHRSVEVGSKRRIVVCAACGEHLDPFEILLQYACDERTFSYTRGELRQLRKSVAELEAKEKNVKARIRRADKKDAERCEAKSVCPLVKQLEYQIRIQNRELLALRDKLDADREEVER